MYKEKLFKPQEMKPLQLVKIELGDVDNLNNEDEDVDESDKVLQELGLNDEDFIDNGEVAENEEEDDEILMKMIQISKLKTTKMIPMEKILLLRRNQMPIMSIVVAIMQIPKIVVRNHHKPVKSAIKLIIPRPNFEFIKEMLGDVLANQNQNG